MLVTKTVYSLYFPETRDIVDALWRERPHELYERNYTKRQDAMHGPLLESWRGWLQRGGVTFGNGLEHAYPTQGASEGIFATLSHIATHSPATRDIARPRVHVLHGEYEGYGFLAQACGLQVVVHERNGYRESLTREAQNGDWIFISEPSAIDGCTWTEFGKFLAFVQGVCQPGRQLHVLVDLTYVGLTSTPLKIAIDHPCVDVVVASLSKPFGVYYHRVGALWSRVELPSLYGNLWFKNLFSVELGRRLLAAFEPGELAKKYAVHQSNAIDTARSAGAVHSAAIASDVVLLAHADLASDDASIADDFRRTPNTARWCLSPAMDAALGGEANRGKP